MKPSPAAIAFQQRFCDKSHGGVFADLPQDVIHEMTFGLVRHP